MSERPLGVAILAFPHAPANGELDALVREPGVVARDAGVGAALGTPDLIVLPGTEATLADLAWLRETGLDRALRAALRAGSMAIAICGGFQMLGTTLDDPDRREGGAERDVGLGVFDLETRFTRDEIHQEVAGTSTGALLPAGAAVCGWEEHGGRSILRGAPRRVFAEDTLGCECPLATLSEDGAVLGTYLHGILSDAAFRAAWLARVRARAR